MSAHTNFIRYVPFTLFPHQRYRENAQAHGNPVIFCHGLGPGLATYAHILQLISARSRFVVAVDFPWVGCLNEEDVPSMSSV